MMYVVFISDMRVSKTKQYWIVKNAQNRLNFGLIFQK